MQKSSKVGEVPKDWQSLLIQSAMKMKSKRQKAKEKAISMTFGKVQFGDKLVLEVQKEMRNGWK